MKEVIKAINDVLINYQHFKYSVDGEHIKLYYDFSVVADLRYTGIFLKIESVDDLHHDTVMSIVDEVHNRLIKGCKSDEQSTNQSHEQLTNPPRYATQSGKQLIELLRDDLLTKEEYIGFLKGNLYKYVFRYQSKGGLDDLKKAQYYLEELQKIVGEEKCN